MFGMGGAARAATQPSLFQTDPGVHQTMVDQLERAATLRPGHRPGLRVAARSIRDNFQVVTRGLHVSESVMYSWAGGAAHP